MSTNQKKLLSIAFAGKRSHEMLHLVEPPLEKLFEAFEKRFKGIHLQLLSGLADGADQIVSTLFWKGQTHERSLKAHRSLGAVLPFCQDEYEKTIQDKAAFNYLYKKCTYELQLDGCSGESGQGDFNYEDAYRQQARILPRLCDVLLAVTEKEDEGLKGGTREAVLAALVQGKPVILLELRDLKFYFYATLEEWHYSIKTPHGAEKIVEEYAALHQKAEQFPGEIEKKDLIYSLRRWMWCQYEGLFSKKKKIDKFEASFGNSDFPIFDRIQRECLKSDESSKYFMFQYRGGYLLNYCLAIAAIFIAVNTSTIHLFKFELRPLDESMANNSILFLDIIKVAIILLIIWNTSKVNNRYYNVKAIQYRFAAERFRVMSYFTLFGMLKIPKPFVGTHVRDHLRKFSGEAHFRQEINEMIMQLDIKRNITKEYLLETTKFVKEHWLEGQLAYYRKDLAKMIHMDRRLSAVPSKLSYIVLIVVIVEILEALMERGLHHDQLFSKWVEWAVPVFIAMTILLPGIITTINSVHFQSEARRLAFRNNIMVQQLKVIISKLEKEINEIHHTAGNSLLQILVILDEAASLTSDEVAEWTMIYEKYTPESG